MKYFRVKWGFGKDDFYSITEQELSKAIRAQVNGTVVVFAEGTISGNNIIAIMPDYNRELGYNRSYILEGEDYARIGSTRREEYLLAMDMARASVKGTPVTPRLVPGASEEIKKLADEKKA